MKQIRVIAALAMLGSGTALADVTTEIEAGAGGVIPQLGVVVDLFGDSALPTASRSAHSIDIGYAYGRGTDKQKLKGGDDPIVFGGEVFTAGQDLNYTINIRFAHLAYRYRHYFGETQAFGIEGLIGVGWAGLGLRARGATQTAAESLGNAGYVLGVGGLWRFQRNTAVYLRILGLSTGAEEGVSSAGRFDLGVQYALGRHASVNAGLGFISAYSARENDRDSDSLKSPINASVGGLTLGAQLIF